MNKIIEKKKNPSKVIGLIIMSVVIIMCICVMIAGAKAVKENKLFTILGYSYSVVVTPSMEDTIMVHDVIIIKTVPFSSLAEKDIIVYYNSKENKNIVHRIVTINSDGSLITKGDNNSSVDDISVTEDIYLGKVTNHGKFLGLGKLITNGKNAIFVVIIFLFLYMMVCGVLNIIVVYKERELLQQKAQRDKEIDERREKLRLEVLKELEEELEQNQVNQK